jgi:hypothetical protein
MHNIKRNVKKINNFDTIKNSEFLKQKQKFIFEEAHLRNLSKSFILGTSV